jgi:hypothetical protein
MQRSRALLDLDSDPLSVIETLGKDRLLRALVQRAPGRRVPGHVDGDELAIRAVLGQQVSLRGAATLAGRLVGEYGERLPQPLGGVTHLFPSTSALAEADPQRLAMPQARRRALLGLAGVLASGDLTLDAGSDRGEARGRLLALPGIGEDGGVHRNARFARSRRLPAKRSRRAPGTRTARAGRTAGRGGEAGGTLASLSRLCTTAPVGLAEPARASEKGS